jgi:hypothetical protein
MVIAFHHPAKSRLVRAFGVPECALVRRPPVWLLLLVLLAVVGLGVYGYFSAPLPLGLSSIIRTPGGGPTSGGSNSGVTPGTRTAAGQPLILGASNVVVQAVQRNQDLSTGGRAGPPGSFTVIQVELQNGGNEPLTPKMSSFRLVDERGRLYAVDPEATRSVNTSTRHRYVFDATVPPGGSLVTLLAFETAPDANALTLRVALGYGEVELPR